MRSQELFRALMGDAYPKTVQDTCKLENEVWDYGFTIGEPEPRTDMVVVQGGLMDGYKAWLDTANCPECGGTGEIVDFQLRKPCPRCR